ncbi:MAG: MBL fold metallo-hydrolase, partial [Anaerolineae bacterium]|nr:MBL fold metallo-hydrolase [Anaerolineae bacterium]
MEEKFEFVEKMPHLYYLNEGHVLTWLLVGSEKAMLVDTAFGKADYKAEIARITDLPVILVNTHLHGDHGGGNNQFDVAYVGVNEPQNGRGVNPAKKTLTVSEGHVFDLGGITVEVIEIPGHTPGSIGLLWVEEKIMITGDTVNPQVLMHFESCLPLSVFRDSMQHLIDLSHRWEKCLFSHGGAEFDVAFVKKLKQAADNIISGAKAGELTDTRWGKAMLYQDDGVGFFYDPQKLK